MTDVKVTPRTKEYRENYSKIFSRGSVKNAPVRDREDEGNNPSPDTKSNTG